MISKGSKLHVPLLSSIFLAAVVIGMSFLRPEFDQSDQSAPLVAPTSSSQPLKQEGEQVSRTEEVREPVEVKSETPPDTKKDEPTKQLRFCDKRNPSDTAACIFDIGLNTAQDTMQYLASSGTTRVLGVEANPILIKDARKRFPKEIAANRLKLLNIGLIGDESVVGDKGQKLTFWVNEKDHFSSFKQTTGCRGPSGEVLAEGNTTFCEKIEMDTMSCSELIKVHGTPDYMKIDIEGLDRECVNSIEGVPKKERPMYISKENVTPFDVQLFTSLGYTRFKVVNQNELQTGTFGTDLNGHSGPWGEEADDFWIKKKWHSLKEIMDRLPLPDTIEVRGQTVKGWYDLHAAK